MDSRFVALESGLQRVPYLIQGFWHRMMFFDTRQSEVRDSTGNTSREKNVSSARHIAAVATMNLRVNFIRACYKLKVRCIVR
jgi:hypothetical protein